MTLTVTWLGHHCGGVLLKQILIIWQLPYQDLSFLVFTYPRHEFEEFYLGKKLIYWLLPSYGMYFPDFTWPNGFSGFYPTKMWLFCVLPHQDVTFLGVTLPRRGFSGCYPAKTWVLWVSLWCGKLYFFCLLNFNRKKNSWWGNDCL